MSSILTIGPIGSDSYQASYQYNDEAEIETFAKISEVLGEFKSRGDALAIIPVYNTRGGEVKESFRLISSMQDFYWIDNVVLPIHLAMGALEDPAQGGPPIHTIVGSSTVFRQCAEYLDENYPDVVLMAVTDIDNAMLAVVNEQKLGVAVIETEPLLKKHSLKLLAREVVSHNRTRFAVLSSQPAAQTGYDATTVLTKPLKDRVGMLVDILGEFTRRGINIIDMQSENDIKTQKLRIYLEVEGHIEQQNLMEALQTVESHIIGEDNSLKILGSFPRIDMRVKKIESFGFIGSGDMSIWFAERLRNEGYRTIVTGRSTEITPADMIEEVDVVMVCVPISVTASTIARFGPLMRDGQALIILAGESENTLASAVNSTTEGVEVMFVHNLWGPQAVAMKDKNATIVRTSRSGSLCSEFEAFLYKHGAAIFHDSARKHDLLMGVGQKLPTTVSVALGMTLKEHQINFNDISSHSTLTSIYGIIAMARIHSQNPRTYAEIMATEGDGRKIVKSFAKNLLRLIKLAEEGEIDDLQSIMDENRGVMPSEFLQTRMRQAKAVDEILSQPNMKMS